MILVAPFLIELFGDWWLIKRRKKDIPLWARVVMIAIASVIHSPGDILSFLVTADITVLNELAASALLATSPFAFFDNLLAWLRGKRGFDYEGKTKGWDKFLARFNPHFLLTVRCVLFASLITLGIWIG